MKKKSYEHSANELITEEELEDRLKFPRGSLRQRRYRGFKLPFVRLGSSIRYHWPTILDYLLTPKASKWKEKPPIPVNDNKKRRGRQRLRLA